MNPNGPFKLAFLGVPIFSLVVGLVIVAAIAAFIFGFSRWRQSLGKVITITAATVLLSLVAVVICVLITVWSGSMG
jgi:hypothetical protein